MATKKKAAKKSRSRLLDATTQRGAEVDQSSAPASEPQESGGLLGKLSDGLKSVFSSSSHPTTEISAAGSAESSTSEPSASGPSLASDIEQKFAAVPDTVGGVAETVATDDGGADEDAAELSNAARIQALIDLGYVDENDGAEIAGEFFDWLSERLGPHWKLDEKRRGKIGRPLAAVINSCAQAVFDNLPDGVGETVSEHPEWTALGIAAGGAALPRAWKTFKNRKQVTTEDGGEVLTPKKSVEVKQTSGPVAAPIATGTFGGR